jgi:hypothetical protein
MGLVFFLSIVIALGNAGDSSTMRHYNKSTAMAYLSEDFEPIALDKLAGVADLTVEANVRPVGDSILVVKVKQRIAGDKCAGEIRVRQFHPSKFEGSPRTIPYQTGQTYILFLKKNGAGDLWTIYGKGGEGEIPVADGFAYFPGRNVSVLEYGQYEVWGNKLHIQRYPFTSFVSALKDYRACFQWSVVEKTSKTEIHLPKLVCDKAKLNEYMNQSPFHKYLAQLSMQRISK